MNLLFSRFSRTCGNPDLTIVASNSPFNFWPMASCGIEQKLISFYYDGLHKKFIRKSYEKRSRSPLLVFPMQRFLWKYILY